MDTSCEQKLNPPHLDFLTLFPETLRPWLTTSILGRAWEKGVFTFEIFQLREFAQDRYRSVDDAPYGGGGGMVFRMEPLVAAVEHIRQLRPVPPKVVSFSPGGRKLTTDLLEELDLQKNERSLLFVCGHYEGIDQRFTDGWVDVEISLGDFVVTGGELPALAMADALLRRVRGTLTCEQSHEEESFSLKDPETGKRLVEYPQYTRPAEYRGFRVPEVLLSGDHGRIARWRQEMARRKTPTR